MPLLRGTVKACTVFDLACHSGRQLSPSVLEGKTSGISSAESLLPWSPNPSKVNDSLPSGLSFWPGITFQICQIWKLPFPLEK